MFRIGDFSKLSQLTVKTLRYYDELGLLKPVSVDRFTGYRYYSADQLPRLNRILVLKDFGLSLEEIARLLDSGLSSDQLLGMLKLKQAEIRQTVEEEQARLARVEARLKQIEQENVMSNYDVVIKKIEPIFVAGVRDIIPSYPEQGHLWNELGRLMSQQKVTPVGACLTLYHSNEPEIDAEVCEPIDKPVPVIGRLLSHELPAVEKMACAIHHGSFVTIGDAYKSILKWIEDNGYRCVGPVREVYVRPADNASQTDPNTVTEIQFPVEKE